MKKTLFIFVLITGLSFASCKDYLDINYNPNQATDGNVTTSMVMPAVEMNLAVTYGNFLRIVGGFYSQHYAHLNGTSNYVDYSSFTMSPVRSSALTYIQLNQRVFANVQAVQQKATAERLVKMLRLSGVDVSTQVTPASEFWPAEERHQKYYTRSGGTPYCHARVKRFD